MRSQGEAPLINYDQFYGIVLDCDWIDYSVAGPRPAPCPPAPPQVQRKTNKPTKQTKRGCCATKDIEPGDARRAGRRWDGPPRGSQSRRRCPRGCCPCPNCGPAAAAPSARLREKRITAKQSEFCNRFTARNFFLLPTKQPGKPSKTR